MSGDREEVALSRWEQERLARIEAELSASDPALNRRLTEIRRMQVGVVLPVVLVALVTLVTFTRWLWVASAGLVVMAAGVSLGIRPLLVRFRRSLRSGPPRSLRPWYS